MIITQLLGGIGNQLFQYALGRALAVKHRTMLKLDTSAFTTYNLRSYALDHFLIEASILTGEEIRQLRLDNPKKGEVKERFARLLARNVLPIIKERSFEFDPAVLNAPAACYLQGYWQSPKYFAEIDALIREELAVRDPLVGKNQEIGDQICRATSVAVHVRRGDYVNNPATTQYHGTCGAAYYQSGELYLLDRARDLRLFVFSDDPNWAEVSLEFRSPTTHVRHNGDALAYEDLRLMMMCRHHIIANSTFSWWAAWLCRHSDKIIIAPRSWFRDAKHGTDDLIPNDWVRL